MLGEFGEVELTRILCGLKLYVVKLIATNACENRSEVFRLTDELVVPRAFSAEFCAVVSADNKSDTYFTDVLTAIFAALSSRGVSPTDIAD